MFVREIKSDEKIKAESPELNPVPGSCEAGNLKQISKHNSYTKYNVAYFADNVKHFFLIGNRDWGIGTGERCP